MATFNRLSLITSDGHSKEHSVSSGRKENGYMYSNCSGHSNTSLNTTTTVTTTTATPCSTATSSARTTDTSSMVKSTPPPYPTKGKLMKNRPSTEAQVSLLAKGPNYAVIPWFSYKGEYMAAIKEVVLTSSGRETQGTS